MDAVEEALRRVDAKKREIDGARPLPAETLQSLRQTFVVRYAHETTAIEGNTLSLSETQVVLEDGITIGGKSIREHLEVLNIRDALQWLETVVGEDTPVDERTVLEMHRIIMAGILGNDAGSYRRHPVFIRGSWHVPPNWVKVPILMDAFGVWLREGRKDEHPVSFAAKAHVELVRIHPFADGNGRTARLLVNLLLMREGYPPAMYSADNRLEYIESLRETDGGDFSRFIVVTAKAVEFMEDRYLELIRQQREAEGQD